MSEETTALPQKSLDSLGTSGSNFTVEHYKKINSVDLIKNLDPTRFIAKDNEDHMLVLNGDFQVDKGVWTIPMKDVTADRVQDLPAYLMKSFVFGDKEQSWYPYCKSKNTLFTAFELTRWVWNMETGRRKFPLTYYDPSKVMDEFNEMKSKDVRTALNNSVATLRASTANQHLVGDRIAIINWLYASNYKKVMRKMYLTKEGEPTAPVMERAAGYFVCTEVADATWAKPLS